MPTYHVCRHTHPHKHTCSTSSSLSCVPPGERETVSQETEIFVCGVQKSFDSCLTDAGVFESRAGAASLPFPPPAPAPPPVPPRRALMLVSGPRRELIVVTGPPFWALLTLLALIAFCLDTNVSLSESLLSSSSSSSSECNLSALLCAASQRCAPYFCVD